MSRLDKTVKGVGVLDPHWTLDRLYATDTDVTEADLKPGTMETTEATKLVPQVLGTQAADVTVRTLASGLPGVGYGVSTQAEVGYFLTETETVADVRYLDQPSKINDWRKPSISIVTPDSSDAAAYPLSGKVAVYWMDSTGSGANHFAVWNPYTNGFENTQALSGRPLSAFVCVPGSERLLRLSFERSGEMGDEYSDDYGATWVVYTDGDARPFGPTGVCSDTAAPRAKPRACFDGGGNLLLVGIDTIDGSCDLFASPDLGVSWTENVLLGAVEDFDVVSLPDGSIGFVYISSGNLCVFSKIATAYDSPFNGERTEPFADFSTVFAAMTFQHCYVAVDNNGVIWVWAENSANDGSWAVAASSDLGVTWFSDWYVRNPFFWSWGGAAARPISFRFAPHARGGLVCAAAFGADFGTGAGIGGMLTWGEWRSNPIEPKVFGARSGTDFDRMWVGWIRPQDGPVWTLTGTATTTLSSSGDGVLSISSTAGALDGHYDATMSVDPRTHADAIFAARCTNDGGSATGVGLKLETFQSASNKHASVTLFLQTDGFRVRDNIAVAFLGAKVMVDLTSRTHFEIHVDASTGEVTVNYRSDTDTNYTQVVETGLTTGATAANGASVDWGQLNGAANAVSGWWYVCSRSPDILAGDEQPRAATGLSTGTNGYPVPDLWDATNERPALLTIHGGHSMIGEEFPITTAADYGVHNVFPDAEPSIARAWRSTLVGADQDIAVDRGSDSTAGSYSVLLLVAGANARFWRLGAKADGAGAYTSLGTLDLAAGFELVGCARTGNILVPGTGVAGDRYIWDGEANAGHVIFDPSGTPVVRRIANTVAGFWDANATGPRAVLVLEDIDGTEPTGGDVAIVWPTGVMVAHLTTAELDRYIRVRCLDTNVSPDPYYSAGVIGVFGLRAYGKDWGNGWEIDQAPNTVGERDAYGTERRRTLGPDRRVLTKSWDHGLNLGRIRGQTDADYIGAAGKAALAARDEVWQRLVSIWRDSDQGANPVVVLMTDPGDGETVTDPTLFLYSYPDGSVRAQQALGQDDEGIFLRVGPIRFAEIK